MNQEILNQIQLFCNVDTVDGTETVKITAICAQVLACKDYIDQLTSKLDTVFSAPEFDFTQDLPKILLLIIELCQNSTFYKDITTSRMKYVLYAVLYAYILLKQIKTIEAGVLRVIFEGAWNLLNVDPKTIKIAEKTFIDCCATCLGCSSKIDIRGRIKK